MKNLSIIIISLVVGAVLAIAVVTVSRSNGYVFGAADNNASVTRTATKNGEASDIPFFSSILGAGDLQEGTQRKTYVETSLGIVLKLFLAVILSGILAFRPRKNFPLFQRTSTSRRRRYCWPSSPPD